MIWFIDMEASPTILWYWHYFLFVCFDTPKNKSHRNFNYIHLSSFCHQILISGQCTLNIRVPSYPFEIGKEIDQIISTSGTDIFVLNWIWLIVITRSLVYHEWLLIWWKCKPHAIWMSGNHGLLRCSSLFDFPHIHSKKQRLYLVDISM